MFLRRNVREVWLECHEWIVLGMKRSVAELEYELGYRVEQIREY